MKEPSVFISDPWSEIPEYEEPARRLPPRTPTVRVPTNMEYGARDVQVNLVPQEFHEWMKAEDFYLMEEAMKRDGDYLEKFQGLKWSSQMPAVIEATVRERFMWLISCGYLSLLEDKWLFNARRYRKDNEISPNDQ